MSLASWKAEFYPVEASESSEADALDHSIRKWEGLTAENLDKHDLVAIGNDLSERQDGSEILGIDVHSCALCQRFQTEDNYCRRCPLFIERGVRCDEVTQDEDDNGISSPFQSFAEYGNPVPMLNLLKKVKAATP